MPVARWKFAAGATALGSVVALLGAELWARQQAPVRVQKFYSARDMHFEMIDGAPVWKQNLEESAERANMDCIDRRPDAPRVAIVGSSIFYSVRLDYAESLGPQLADVLETQRGERPCVTNLSEAGYTFQPQWARASTELPAFRPDVLIWEVWFNSPFEFKVLDDAAYNFGRLELDSTGHPNPLDLNPGTNRWLLDHSGLYRYGVIGSTPEQEKPPTSDWEEFAVQEMTMLIDWAHAEGIALLLVFCPSLNQSFESSLEKTKHTYDHVHRLAAERGVTTVTLAEEFLGLHPEDLGLDSCCHFNAHGTTEVARRIAPEVNRLLDEAEGRK